MIKQLGKAQSTAGQLFHCSALNETLEFKLILFNRFIITFQIYFNSLTLELPWVTKREFLLTISTRQVMRIKKNINLGVINKYYIKFSELTL